MLRYGSHMLKLCCDWPLRLYAAFHSQGGLQLLQFCPCARCLPQAKDSFLDCVTSQRSVGHRFEIAKQTIAILSDLQALSLGHQSFHQPTGVERALICECLAYFLSTMTPLCFLGFSLPCFTVVCFATDSQTRLNS